MTTSDDLRRVALSLPHASEKPHFDRTSFRVDAPKGKIFVTMPTDGVTANLMLTRETQDVLCAAEPTIFAPVPNKWGDNGATTITLAAADEATLRSALISAWRNAAPPKIRAANPDL
jgi:hypothetical protein